jgi:hypothetical protein
MAPSYLHCLALVLFLPSLACHGCQQPPGDHPYFSPAQLRIAAAGQLNPPIAYYALPVCVLPQAAHCSVGQPICWQHSRCHLWLCYTTAACPLQQGISCALLFSAGSHLLVPEGHHSLHSLLFIWSFSMHPLAVSSHTVWHPLSRLRSPTSHTFCTLSCSCTSISHTPPLFHLRFASTHFAFQRIATAAWPHTL